MHINKNWKLNDEHIWLDEVFHEVVKHAETLGLLKENEVDGVYIVEPKRRAYGYCDAHKLTSKKWETAIAINERVLVSKRAVLNVIVHEVAHACMPDEGHSKRWKAIGDKIGRIYGIEVHTTDDYSNLGVESWDEEVTAKYTVECPNCHMKWDYRKKSRVVQHPEAYCCAKCAHTLVRSK